MNKITPCLWFDGQAEQAANFYASVFKNSKIGEVSRYTPESSKVSGMPEGSVMSIMFNLDGQEFMALNGGPEFVFTPAISFIVYCKTQEEIDSFWEKLTDRGEEVQCGWLRDRFGVSWQIVPEILDKMMIDRDENKVHRVTEAFLKMKKIDIKELEQAYNS